MMYGAIVRFEEFDEKAIVPRFNVAPSQSVPVIRLDKDGARVANSIRWGLIPFFTKGKPTTQPINARAETVATSGMFRQAFQRRRCLQVADGFYEWKKIGEEKQPMFIRFKDDRPFAFAGIWERWIPEEGAEPVDTVCHVTTKPNSLMAPIHNRMPVILRQEYYEKWLDKDTNIDAIKRLLRPLPDDELEAYPVTRAVNSPKNDTAENVKPI